MRLLLDANMPRSSVALLEGMGHQVEHARDLNLAAAPDAELARHALTSGAVFITRDLDFADIRHYPPESYPGIVVMRLPDDAVAAEIVQVLERFFLRMDLSAKLPGHLVILESHQVRFRPPV